MRHKLLRAFSFIELLAVLGIIAVVAFIFFPVFAKSHPDRTPQGLVVDGRSPRFGKPMPGAILRFRDASHHLVATVISDRWGEFRRADLPQICGDSIDGFALVMASRSTGGPDGIYWFAPTGRLDAAIHNAFGKAVPGIGMTLESTLWSWRIPANGGSISATSDEKGHFFLPNVPLCATFDIKSDDMHYVVGKTTRSLGPAGLHYDVTLASPAIITGRLVSSAGKPLAGFYAFVTASPYVDNGEGRYRVGMTGTNGRFRIAFLPPGTYYVSAKPPRTYHSIAVPKRVRIAAGQTVEVLLQSTSLQ